MCSVQLRISLVVLMCVSTRDQIKAGDGAGVGAGVDG